MNKELVKTLSFLSVVLLLLFVTDRICGAAMWWVNQHTKDITGPKIRHLMTGVDADVVMLGASSCNLHYVPSIMSDTLGLSVYNGGIDASDNIYAHYFVLRHLLLHSTPKVVVLETMAPDCRTKLPPFRTLGFFAPYIGTEQVSDSLFRMAGTYWPYMISHLYRYNSKAVSNLLGLLVDKQKGSDNGYIAQGQPPAFPQSLEQDALQGSVDSLKLEYLQRLIDLCRKKEVKLVFSVSPKYVVYEDTVYAPIREIAMRNHVPMLNYHESRTYQDFPDYFHDILHLWDKGARLYSSTFAHDLKHIISVTPDISAREEER